MSPPQLGGGGDAPPPINDDLIRTLLKEPWTAPDVVVRFPPFVGREAELEKLVHDLGLVQTPHVLLLGEPGVGKTALVQGLARRMAEGTLAWRTAEGFDRPRQLFAIDVTALRSHWAGVQGKIIRALLEYAAEHKLVLFIDEFHLIAHMHMPGVEPMMDLMKPYLRDHDLRVIGATTLAEYKQFLASDIAFDSRFNKIPVLPPSPSQTIHILANSLERYEAAHETSYSSDVLTAIVEMADRYVAGALPNTAVRVLDHAGRHASSGVPNVRSLTVNSLSDVVRKRKRIPPRPEVKNELTQLAKDAASRTPGKFFPDPAVTCPAYLIDALAERFSDANEARAALIDAYERASREEPNMRDVTTAHVRQAIETITGTPPASAAAIVHAARDALRPFVDAARLIADTIEDLFELEVGDVDLKGKRQKIVTLPGDETNPVEARLQLLREKLPRALHRADAELTLTRNIIWERAEKEPANLNVYFLSQLTRQTLVRRGRYVGDGGQLRKYKQQVWTGVFHAVPFRREAVSWMGLSTVELAEAACAEFAAELRAARQQPTPDAVPYPEPPEQRPEDEQLPPDESDPCAPA